MGDDLTRERSNWLDKFRIKMRCCKIFTMRCCEVERDWQRNSVISNRRTSWQCISSSFRIGHPHAITLECTTSTVYKYGDYSDIIDLWCRCKIRTDELALGKRGDGHT